MLTHQNMTKQDFRENTPNKNLQSSIKDNIIQLEGSKVRNGTVPDNQRK